ncbi:VCBS repeat-containing protein [Polaribacter sp.]|nr:VCBS repeat-containing protein [Polaribacter sp.]
MFTENSNVIELENRNRRKFDNAVIADLDQDGYLDILLTEHSRRVEIYWNNKGIFSKGEPFIFGDTHGIAIGDYNFDGIIEILVQSGGGDGKNPRKIKYYNVSKKRKITKGGEYKHFDGSRGRAVKLVDVDNNGSLDLITSAFPAIKHLDKGNVVYKRDDKLEFDFVSYLPHADRMAMRTSLTDFNNDNITDVIFHGGNRFVAVNGNKGLTFEDVTQSLFKDLTNIKLINSVSEIDFDNDGDTDLFLTRSKHPFDSESEYDETQKTFYFFARRKAFEYNNLEVEGDLKIENLQMAFPNFDIFIGENKTSYKRKKDKHGHIDATITQKEAKGFPEDISKKALYIGYLGNNLWKIAGHTNSPTSAVLHNVISKPAVIELKIMPAKLLENRNGVFVDVTNQLNINIKEQTTSAAVGDFNNDGWSDLFIVRYGKSASTIAQFLYLNQEGKKFVKQENHGIIRKELGATGMGADAFDYDKDGDLDIIYSNERGKWHLFTNNSKNDNNFIEVNVGYSPSKKATAMGAVLNFSACGNQYKRVVGATSSSYSHTFNTFLHVGLGKCKKVENATLTWSNGETLPLQINDLNKIYTAGNIKLK